MKKENIENQGIQVAANGMKDKQPVRPQVLYFPEKYRKSLRMGAWLEILAVKKDHPDWELEDLLADIKNDTTSRMPPEFLPEYLQLIIEEWEIAKQKKRASFGLKSVQL